MTPTKSHYQGTSPYLQPLLPIQATPIPAIPRRERFIVPIRATGGGALLDMPDEVDFGLSPVKYEAPKTIMAGAPGRPNGGLGAKDHGGWRWIKKEIHEFDEFDDFDEIAPFVGPYFGMFVILVYDLPYALTSRLRSVFCESWKGFPWIATKVRNVGEKPTKFLLKVVASDGLDLTT